MWRRTNCTSAPLLRAEARRAEHSRGVGDFNGSVGVETRLVFASSLSIVRGPLCETRQVIHWPDHFKINWFPCTLHFSGKCRVYRGSLQPGDIHMGILTDDMKRIVRE